MTERSEKRIFLDVRWRTRPYATATGILVIKRMGDVNTWNSLKRP